MEANAPLVRLVQGAATRGIDRLLDDDALTLGHGAGAQTFDAVHLPETPDWEALHDIPLALVTGTNGKTTTTRLIAAMGQVAGRVSGLSSTEFVRVGDQILDRGDYSGPAGARLLLRDPRVELGVLEVARGGILRARPAGHAGAGGGSSPMSRPIIWASMGSTPWPNSLRSRWPSAAALSPAAG